MNDATTNNGTPSNDRPRKATKFCATCQVSCQSSADKKAATRVQIEKRLRLTPQDIRNLYSDLLAAAIKFRIRRKIAEAAIVLDEITEDATNGPDDYKAPAPAVAYDTTTIPEIRNPNDIW